MSDCRFGVSPVNYPDPDPDSNALVVEAHGLEYRTFGRLTQTFIVCIEEPIDWCTADNKSIRSHLLVTKHCRRTKDRIHKLNLNKVYRECLS